MVLWGVTPATGLIGFALVGSLHGVYWLECVVQHRGEHCVHIYSYMGTIIWACHRTVSHSRNTVDGTVMGR